MLDVTGQDDVVLGYIAEWWRRHPEELDWLDQLEARKDIDDFRLRLWDDVNAMTDGALGLIVERGGLDWIYLVGAATAQTLKEKRRLEAWESQA